MMNEINILDFAKIIDKTLEINFNPGLGVFQCRFEHSETKEGAILSSDWNAGYTPQAAIIGYCNKISGKLLVFNAMSKDNRQEFKVPKLTYGT